MSYVNRILSAMRYDQEYTPDEVAAIAKAMTADTRNYLIEQDGKVTPYPDPQEVDDEGSVDIGNSQEEAHKRRIRAICRRCGYDKFIIQAGEE